MKAYLVRRGMASIVVILLSSVAVFVIMSVIPGDAVQARFQLTTDGPQQRAYRAELRLDDPVAVRYLRWLGDMARLDFGTAVVSREPIGKLLRQRLPATLQLGLMAFAVSLAVGLTAGVLAASHRNTWLDVLANLGATTGAAVPIFVTAFLFMYVFSLKLSVFPTSGYVPFTEDPVENLQRMALPVLTLGLAGAALIMRTTRAATLEVLQRDYTRTARAKGLAPRTVLVRHALRNALIPILTVLGFEIGGIFSGAVITESVFDIPGMGRLLLDGIVRERDYVLVQTVAFLGVVVLVVVNFLVDIAYAWADPRIRFG